MKRFDPDTYYPTDAPELAIIGTRGTMAQWRHRNEGPPYTRFGNKVLYLGSDLNAFLDKHRIETADHRTRIRAAHGDFAA